MLKKIYKYEGGYLSFNRSKGGKLFKIVLDEKIYNNPFTYSYENCLSFPVDAVYMTIVINNAKDTERVLPW